MKTSMTRAVLAATAALSIAVLYQNCGSEEFNVSNYNSAEEPPPPPPPPPGPSDCTLPGGNTAVNGTEVDFYTRATAACGETCPSVKLKCDAGQFKDAAGIVTDTTALNISCPSMKLFCDARTVAGNQVTTMGAGKPYLVNVYGVTASRGQDGATLNPVRVTNCQGVTLATTGALSINWHDGQAPHSGAFAITAPADGCIRGFTDNGNALTMTVLERPNAGVTVNSANLNLDPDRDFMVAVHGVTENRGGTEILLGTRVIQTGTATTLAGDTSTTINGPDGRVPVMGLFTLRTPTNGAITGQVDGLTTNTQALTAFEVRSPTKTTVGNSVSGLTPGRKYLAHVYGVTTSRGEGVSATMLGVRVVDCANNATILASTPNTFINWHDGQAVQSASLIVTAPAGGCIRGFNDNTVKFMTTVEVD